MQSDRAKSQGGIFQMSQPTIRIFSEDRLIQFINLKADVFQSLARTASLVESNVSARG